MADADVQGMLIRIEATTAQLRQEIARGDAAVAQSAGKMDTSLGRIDSAFDRTGANASVLQSAVSSAFNGITLASAGAVAGLVAITVKTASYAQEVRNLSSLANASTTDFQRFAAGAKTVGVEQEKLSDILKDVNDRAGEFISTGGGEMKDFFTNIAPKVGVTAEMFRNLSGPQALQLYYNSLEKANLNQQEMTFYMEAMADETTALIPLLRNNGKGFKDFGDQAERTGKVLSTIQIDRLVAVNQSIRNLETSFEGASNQLVVGLLPSIEDVTQRLNGMSDNGAMEVLGSGIGFLVDNINILAGVLGGKVAASFISYATQVLASTKSTVAEALAVKANAAAKVEQAAASAALAAALANEASATVVEARATESAALAKVRVIQAARDQLAYTVALSAGTSEAAKYTSALAAADLELAAAKKAATQAGVQLGVVLNAETAALAKDTAATAADAVAKRELAAASSLAGRAGSGLLALLGGPAGIAALAIGAGIAFLTMRDNTKQASLSLDDMQAPLDQVIAKFKTLNEDQRKAALVRWGEAQAAAAKTAASEFGNLAASIRSATVDPGQARLGGYSVQLKEYSDLIQRLKEAQANGQALTPILEGLRGKSGIDNAQIDSWIKQAGVVSDAGVVLKDVTLKLNEQTGALAENTAGANANNAAKKGMSEAGTTYLQALQKQLAGLQDGGDATNIANRYISEHSDLTDADKTAILSAASAIEANKEATKRATAETKSGTSAAKEAATEAKNQAKALTDLKAQADIAIRSATGLAAAYLAGTDKSREFTLQQKVEEALLKTGAGVRKDVEKAIKDQQDAQDRLNISKSAFDLQIETSQLIDQAKATLQGTDALAAYNVQKTMTIALAGKNIEVGSKEYEQLLAATKAQQDAVKVAQQAANAGGIMERLYPEAKLLKDYTEDQKALNAAMALYPENAANYQAALLKLGNEYEVNRSKATIWGQMTEGAIDRIDEAFASAWGNIGDGANTLWDNLKKGFKQTLGEIAHMLTTKPLLASISNWLTGTDNGQGLSSVWSKLLGSAGGSSGSGGSPGFGGMASLGKNLYSAYSAITGVGAEIMSGYASGGIGGAISGGAGYYGSMLSSLGSTISGGFSSMVTAITGGTATTTAATSALGSTLSGAVAEGAASIGTNIGVGGATTAAAGANSGMLASMGAMWPLAVVMGMYQSGKLYDSGVRPDAGEIRDSAGSTTLGKVAMAPGAATSKFFEGLDGALSKVVGGKWAAILSGSTLHQAVTKMVGEKLFGTGYQTKDTGWALDVQGGVFDAQSYQDQKKKGGWISGSSKKRTLYGDLPQDTMDALGDAYNDTVLQVGGLFSNLGVVLSESVLDGLNMPQFKISTQGKTQEEIQAQLDIFFTALGNEAVFAISQATNAGLSGFTFEGLQVFVKNLQDVNGVIKHLNVGLFDMTATGGFMAEQLTAWAGGLDALKTSVAGYYDKFYTDTEKATNTLADVTEEFKNLGIVLPESREGYRDMVEGIDKTTEAGRAMFLTLTGLSGDASTAYDILKQRADAAQAASEAASQAALVAAQTLKDALLGAVTGAMGAVQRAITADKDAATKAYNARVTSLNDMVSTATENVSGLTSVGNDLSAALKALRGDSDDAVKMLRAQAQATLQSALAISRAGGSLSGFTGLEDALDTVSNNNTDLYGSMEDFARDQGRTANVVAELNAINGVQLTTEQQLLKTVQDQVDDAKAQFDAQMDGLDAQLAFAQSQLDALNGIDNSVISVAMAMSGLSSAITAALAAKPAGSAAANTSANNSTLLGTVYQSVLGRDVDAAGAAYWGGLLQSGGIDYAGLVAAITHDAKANGELKGYATGGLINGPGTGTSDSIFARLSSGEYVMSADAVRMFGTGLLDQMNAGQLPAFATGGGVGEMGPQLEVTGPSRIYNANQTAAMLKGGGDPGATAADLKALIDIVRVGLDAIAKSSKQTSDNTGQIAEVGVQVNNTVQTKVLA